MKNDKPKTKMEKFIRWVDKVLMKQMDKFAYLRAITLCTLVAFFIGENLNVYIYLFIGITYYMLFLRVFRWIVKRWLLYMLEFCYFGLTFYTLFLLFAPENKTYWLLTFTYSCGNMALAIYVFNGSAQFSSTDHISSAWLHFAPMMTSWAIRWKHIIYKNPGDINFIISDENMSIQTNEIIQYFIYYPVIFWCAWMLYYSVVLYYMLDHLIDKYDTGLTCFLSIMKGLKFIFKDNFSGIKWKYLLMHFVLFAIGIPISIICYFSFYFHCFYIILIIVILFYNAGVQQAILVKKLNDKKVKEKFN